MVALKYGVALSQIVYHKHQRCDHVLSKVELHLEYPHGKYMTSVIMKNTHTTCKNSRPRGIAAMIMSDRVLHTHFSHVVIFSANADEVPQTTLTVRVISKYALHILLM